MEAVSNEGEQKKKNPFPLETFYDLCLVFKLLRNSLLYPIIIKWYPFTSKSNLNMFSILF